jgi:hypothetical protein
LNDKPGGSDEGVQPATGLESLTDAAGTPLVVTVENFA